MDKLFFALLLSGASLSAWANPSHDFPLAANSKIQQTCRTSSGSERSKLKIKVLGSSALGLTLKICSPQYGFRKITANVSIPSILLDVDRMMGIRPGTSVNAGGATVTRNQDSNGGMNISVSGINGRVSKLSIHVPAQEGWARRVRGGSRMLLPWSALQFSYSHPVAGTFNISGRLSEIQSN